MKRPATAVSTLGEEPPRTDFNPGLLRLLRFPVRLRVTLAVGELTLEGRTRNVSFGGLSVCLDGRPVAMVRGQAVRLTCHGPTGPLRLEATVRWFSAAASDHRGAPACWVGLEMAEAAALQSLVSSLRVHLLVASEDPEQRALVARVLGPRYSVHCVSTAEEALALLDAQELGVLLAGELTGDPGGGALIAEVQRRFPGDLAVKVSWGAPGVRAREVFWQIDARLPAGPELQAVVDGAVQHYWARREPKLYFLWSQQDATGGRLPISLDADRQRAGLRRMTLFEGMSDAAFEAVCARFTVLVRKRGERLFEAGETGDAMYILRSGEVRVLAPSPEGGPERTLRYLGPGSTIGEMALLLDQPRTASVEMSVDGELLVLSRDDLEELLGDHPELSIYLSRELARRFTQPVGTRDVEVRLVASLGAELATELAWGLERLGVSVAVLSTTGRLPPTRCRPTVLEEPVEASERGLIRRLGELLSLFDRVVVVLPPSGAGCAPRLLEHVDALVMPAGPVAPWALAARRTLAVGPGRLETERLARRIGKRVVGLALSSGGAWGVAHLGVLQVLEEEGVPVDLIAGASAGALFGALHCAGWSRQSLRSFALEELVRSARLTGGLLDVGLHSWAGLVSGKRLRDWLDAHLEGRTFEQLRTPLHVVCADVSAGRERVLTRGSVADAVRASIGVPGMFTPWKVDGAYLVDGGMVNPLPVSVLQEQGADLIIASSVTGAAALADRPSSTKPPSYMEQLVSLMAAMESETLKVRRPRVDVLVRPRVGQFSLVEYERAAELLEAGVQAARSHLEALGVIRRRASLDPR